MSTEHRKPLVAFVVLALAAAVLVGVQRAEAQAGRMFAAVIEATVRVQSPAAAAPELPLPSELQQASVLGPVFTSLREMSTAPGPRRLTLVVFETEPGPVRRTGASGSAASTSVDRAAGKRAPQAGERGRATGRGKAGERRSKPKRSTSRPGKQHALAARASTPTAAAVTTSRRYVAAAAPKPIARRSAPPAARAHATQRRVRSAPPRTARHHAHRRSARPR